MADQIASMYAKVGADTSEFNRKMKGVEKDMQGAGKQASAFGKIMKVGFGAAVAGGAAAIGGLGVALGVSVNKAMSMEQAIADISAAMNLSADETSRMGGLIRDLGLDPKLKVSAEEAAAAIGVLGTAGLSVSDILDGAARSTVLLSNATGTDMANAAATASDVMAIFGIQAKDMDAAVNGILATTQASKFSFDDYALALAQGGGVAATVGVEFDDFNAAIAAISPLFGSGSDAGTSFKTMLTALVPKSNAAEDAMAALGIITAEGKNRFFDANGQLKSMAEIADILNTSLAGLSEEQKNQALSTIFGSDAMRAAAALAGYTDEKFNTLKATMKNTDAEQAAATRMDTLSGKMDIFQGIIDQTATDIGMAIMPQLRSLADILITMATDNGPAVVEFFKNVANYVVDLMNKFGAHWPTISKIVTTAADSIGTDIGRIIGSLGLVVNWFTGPGANAETDWSKFWLGVLSITASAVSAFTKMVADLLSTFNLLGEGWQALGAGDWGKLMELDQQARELAGKLNMFTSPMQYGFEDWKSKQGKASGGPVSAGQSYVVGEQGPELFVPSSNGTIMPNGWDGGERTLRVVVESPLPTNRQAIRDLAIALKRELDLTGAVMVR